jgi:hypothetical protein
MFWQRFPFPILFIYSFLCTYFGQCLLHCRNHIICEVMQVGAHRIKLEFLVPFVHCFGSIFVSLFFTNKLFVWHLCNHYFLSVKKKLISISLSHNKGKSKEFHVGNLFSFLSCNTNTRTNAIEDVEFHVSCRPLVKISPGHFL